MWRTFAAAALLAVALAAPGPAHARGLTWIGIGGPADWTPRAGYALEVGHHAWRIDAVNGGGVLSLPLASDTIVRVRRLPDCTPVVRFVAVPGRQYFIRFAVGGSVRVEDLTGEGMDSGPALGDPTGSTCPALPDTATTATSPSSRGPVPIVLVGVGVAAGVVALLRSARRSRDRRSAAS